MRVTDPNTCIDGKTVSVGNMQWVLKVLAELSKLVCTAALGLFGGCFLLALSGPQVNLGYHVCCSWAQSRARVDLAQLTFGCIGR